MNCDRITDHKRLQVIGREAAFLLSSLINIMKLCNSLSGKSSVSKSVSVMIYDKVLMKTVRTITRPQGNKAYWLRYAWLSSNFRSWLLSTGQDFVTFFFIHFLYYKYLICAFGGLAKMEASPLLLHGVYRSKILVSLFSKKPYGYCVQQHSLSPETRFSFVLKDNEKHRHKHNQTDITLWQNILHVTASSQSISIHYKIIS